MLRLSAAVGRLPASPPPPPRAAVLLCNHITRSNSISPSLRRDTLDSANAGGTRTIPPSAQPFGGLLSQQSIRRRGGRRVDAKKDTRTGGGGGGDRIHMEREKEKGGEGEKYKRTKGAVV